jgi:type I restriction enzyme S subunit
MKNNKPQKNTPEGWKELKLSEVGVFGKGKGISKKDLSLNGKCAVRYGELYTKHNFKITKIYSYISEYVSNKSKEIKKGNILFAGSGETIEEIGKSAVYLKDEECYAGGDIIIFSPKKQNSLFLSYCLNIGEARKELRKLGQGQSVVHIYKKDLENMNVIIPKIKEQKLIVSVLETWDQVIEKLAKKIEIKKNVKKGLMQNLLTGKVRLAGFKGEWKSIKLSDICKRIRTGKLDANAMIKNGKYRFYTCAKNYYKINDYAFDTEALLVSGNGANVGYIHYYKGKFNAYQRTYVLDKFTSDIMFTKYILDQHLRKRIFEEKCDGNTPYIKMGTLTEMKLEIPETKDEQEKIADVIITADSEIKMLEKKLSIMKDQKKYLLDNLVTGKIRVPKFKN